MAKKIDIFGELPDDGDNREALSPAELQSVFNFSKSKAKYVTKKAAEYQKFVYDLELDYTIPPEQWAERNALFADYVTAHEKVFPASTGQKPFGEEQQTAIRRFQRIVQSRGKLVQAEPRGFAKTSRAVNQLLLGILEGQIRFALVVSSALDKSEDIMEQLKTELISNEHLHKIFPNVMACFEHSEGKSHKASRQTINGEPSGLQWTNDQIIFPAIPGEPSSGAIILVRTKENLRGISKKVRYGENAGKVQRPDFILLDDIQTDKDAASPTVCQKIINTVKRSAMFGGSHSKKIRAIMTITPHQLGDVATHFMLNEPSWEVAQYPMLKRFPTNMDLWDEYASILLNFDKRKEGDRERAQRRAARFVKDNYDALHEGAEASWEWAYEWDTDDPIELSAVHHAMTFFYEEGEDAFNYECQCKVDNPLDDEEILKASPEVILSRTSHLSRRVVPVEGKYVVTHVDCNQEILTYMTMASDTALRPVVIDYGTFPPQPGAIWKKKDLAMPLYKYYPDIQREDIAEQIYCAVKDLSSILARTKYIREDGIEMMHRWIAFDTNWQTDHVLRAIRECEYRSLVLATTGLFFGVKDRPMMETPIKTQEERHFHCYTTTASDNVTFSLRLDTNSLKTLVHRGFLAKPGTIGSIRLFLPEGKTDHKLLTEQLCAEDPEQKINVKDNRVVTEWHHTHKHVNNEALDNIVGCLGLLFKCGCTLNNTKEIKRLNMAQYLGQA